MTAIAAIKREQFGSKAAQRERDAGRVPVSISTGGQPSIHVTLSHKDAERLAGGGLLGTLTIDGVDQQVLIKAVDRHPIKDMILHMDLQAINDETRITAEIPIEPDVLHCPGIKVGGLLEVMRRTVAVRCLAKDLPTAIRVPMDTVQVTDTVLAEACEMPAGVIMVTKPRVAMVSILLTRGMRKAKQEGDVE